MSDKNLLSSPIRDTFALAGISGIVGTLIMYLFGIPIYMMDLSKSIYLLYSVEFFVKPSIARTLTGSLSGAVIGIIVGVGLAIGFKLLLHFSGTDWYYFKAVGYGGLMWFFWVGLTRSLIQETPYLFNDLQSNMILLLESLIYSVAMAYTMLRLGGLEILPDGDAFRDE